MTANVTLQELERLILDPAVPDKLIREYVRRTTNGARPLAPQYRADTARIALPPGPAGMAGLAQFNARLGALLSARRSAFVDTGKPVIVAEGDSWFDHPLFWDVMTYLDDEYDIVNLSHRGDTVAEMVAQAQYLPAFESTGARLFLLSGGGNDIFGAPVFENCLNKYDSKKDARGHLTPYYDQVLNDVMGHYETILQEVSGLGITTICHGYDYAIPNSSGDVAKGFWMAQPFTNRRIGNPALQQDIVNLIVDDFNERLQKLAASMPNVVYVNLRGTVDANEWLDELHPSFPGFAKIARKLAAAIRVALPRPVILTHAPALVGLAGAPAAGGVATPAS